jgi:hypothetical protein
MNRSEGLDLMANLLESTGWAPHRFGYLGFGPTDDLTAWTPNFQTPCCIEGADHRVQMLLFRVPYPPVKFLPEPPEGYEGWSQWNDAEGRTQQQVIECLRNMAAVKRIEEMRERA